jgi:hypothetical protein
MAPFTVVFSQPHVKWPFQNLVQHKPFSPWIIEYIVKSARSNEAVLFRTVHKFMVGLN